MKDPISNPKSNKGIIICLLLVVVSSSTFSQNKLANLVLSLDYQSTVPIICVLALAVFMITAFIKQKDH